jgi:hypothetical protein
VIGRSAGREVKARVSAPEPAVPLTGSLRHHR